MKKPVAIPGPSASALITQRIAELPDWRGKTLARMRKLIRDADPGESYKQIVKRQGNTRRAG